MDKESIAFFMQEYLIFLLPAATTPTFKSVRERVFCLSLPLRTSFFFAIEHRWSILVFIALFCSTQLRFSSVLVDHFYRPQTQMVHQSLTGRRFSPLRWTISLLSKIICATNQTGNCFPEPL